MRPFYALLALLWIEAIQFSQPQAKFLGFSRGAADVGPEHFDPIARGAPVPPGLADLGDIQLAVGVK